MALISDIIIIINSMIVRCLSYPIGVESCLASPWIVPRGRSIWQNSIKDLRPELGANVAVHSLMIAQKGSTGLTRVACRLANF